MSIITNIVAALAITTTSTVQIPCPDGMPGCCVLHEKTVSKTRYEPVKIKELDNSGKQHGVAINIEYLVKAMNFSYEGRIPPQLIPIKVYKKGNDGAMPDVGGHVVGFIITDVVNMEVDRCGISEVRYEKKDSKK